MIDSSPPQTTANEHKLDCCTTNCLTSHTLRPPCKHLPPTRSPPPHFTLLTCTPARLPSPHSLRGAPAPSPSPSLLAFLRDLNTGAPFHCWELRSPCFKWEPPDIHMRWGAVTLSWNTNKKDKQTGTRTTMQKWWQGGRWAGAERQPGGGRAPAGRQCGLAVHPVGVVTQ